MVGQKLKQNIISKSKHKKEEGKSGISYEYNVGDQVLIKTPLTLWILLTPHTRAYSVPNVYKCDTIIIQ
jgi:hypothetical protein